MHSNWSSRIIYHHLILKNDIFEIIRFKCFISHHILVNLLYSYEYSKSKFCQEVCKKACLLASMNFCKIDCNIVILSKFDSIWNAQISWFNPIWPGLWKDVKARGGAIMAPLRFFSFGATKSPKLNLGTFLALKITWKDILDNFRLLVLATKGWQISMDNIAEKLRISKV